MQVVIYIWENMFVMKSVLVILAYCLSRQYLVFGILTVLADICFVSVAGYFWAQRVWRPDVFV